MNAFSNLIGLPLIILSLNACGPSQEEIAESNRLAKAKSDERQRIHKAQLDAIKERYTIKEPTAEEAALTKTRSRAYYAGLISSIRQLDDGVSPASTVARAAISDNIDLMRSWKEAQLAPHAKVDRLAVETALTKLPPQSLVDEATAIVLRNRKGDL